MFTPSNANDLISSATWIASSLVGARIIAWTPLAFLSNLSRRGIPNDAVFPVPVCAWPIISLSPFNKRGITPAWTGDGYS